MMAVMCGAPKGDNLCATAGLPSPQTEPGRLAPWVGWHTNTNLLSQSDYVVLNEFYESVNILYSLLSLYCFKIIYILPFIICQCIKCSLVINLCCVLHLVLTFTHCVACILTLFYLPDFI